MLTIDQLKILAIRKAQRRYALQREAATALGISVRGYQKWLERLRIREAYKARTQTV